MLLGIIWLDVWTYLGYSATHLYISQKIALFGIIGISIWIVTTRRHFTKKVSWPWVCGIILLVVYALVTAVEGTYGQGYIYAHLRLRPESLYVATLGTLIALSTEVVNGARSLLLVLVMSFYLARLLPIVTTQSFVVLKEVIRHPWASYDDKMGLVWGEFYADIQRAKAATHPSDTIGIPTDIQKYPLHGNAALVRYFLYPREIISVSENVPMYRLIEEEE